MSAARPLVSLIHPCAEYYRQDIAIKLKQREAQPTGDAYARIQQMQAGDEAVILRMSLCIHTLKCPVCRAWLRTQ